MHIELATEPGDPATPNQDFAAAGSPASGLGGALVVLDGVTPPAGADGCTHGVPWYVARLGGALLELSISRRDMTLAQCLGEAISRAAAAHYPICDLSHPRTPQATVVLARWADAVGQAPADDPAAGALEYLVLSDSVLLLESTDGTVTAVLDDRLDRVLERVRGSAGAERVAAVEALRNAPDGFLTAAADPAVAALAVTGTVPRAQVRSVAALTDGATRWTEVFAHGDLTALHTVLRTEGPRGLIARVRDAERADPDGARHPRGKAHDDATAVLVHL